MQLSASRSFCVSLIIQMGPIWQGGAQSATVAAAAAALMSAPGPSFSPWRWEMP
jgi:hypothetical protein